jgi:hypothetical protein
MSPLYVACKYCTPADSAVLLFAECVCAENTNNVETHATSNKSDCMCLLLILNSGEVAVLVDNLAGLLPLVAAGKRGTCWVIQYAASLRVDKAVI